MMENIIGKWGLYPWFNEDGEDMIDDNDVESFKRLIPYGKVFYCESESDGYIILRYAEKTYKVKPKLFYEVEPPKFTFHEEVIICNKNERGVIMEIQWHHGKSQEFYFLNIRGKRKNSRYFSNELELSTKS